MAPDDAAGKERARDAVGCFRRANELRREFESFKGLVDAYQKVPSYKDALSCAKQALDLNRKNVRAITLVGTVMATSSKEGMCSVGRRLLVLSTAMMRTVTATVLILMMPMITLTHWYPGTSCRSRNDMRMTVPR